MCGEGDLNVSRRVFGDKSSTGLTELIGQSRSRFIQ